MLIYWIWQSSDVLRICCFVLRDDRRINDLKKRINELKSKKSWNIKIKKRNKPWSRLYSTLRYSTITRTSCCFLGLVTSSNWMTCATFACLNLEVEKKKGKKFFNPEVMEFVISKVKRRRKKLLKWWKLLQTFAHICWWTPLQAGCTFITIIIW